MALKLTLRGWEKWANGAFLTYDEDERGMYGRYIARIVRRSDRESLNDRLVQRFGEEVRYDG
jgi:hypothetical protein